MDFRQVLHFHRFVIDLNDVEIQAKQSYHVSYCLCFERLKTVEDDAATTFLIQNEIILHGMQRPAIVM